MALRTHESGFVGPEIQSQGQRREEVLSDVSTEVGWQVAGLLTLASLPAASEA